MAPRKTTAKDPHAAREAKKYAQPIPSREYILGFLKKQGRPCQFNTIANGLKLSKPSQQQALQKRLQAMCRDGQLMQNRRKAYCLLNQLDVVKGRVQAHKDGHGFVIPEDDSGLDICLPSKEMRELFDGDRVLVQVVGFSHDNKPLGKLVECIERRPEAIVGRFYPYSDKLGRVCPENKRITHEILVPLEDSQGAAKGDVVAVAIDVFPAKGVPALGKVIEVIGQHMAPGMEIDIAKRVYGLPFQWSEAVGKELATFADKVTKQDLKKRTDMRHLPFVTIDGADAKDFDDAVYCEARPDGGWRLWVAIADVSHYVKKGSALDTEATERGTSVYFPKHVVPMLPEELSNELCSLKPDVDRLALVAKMQISPEGKVTRSEFHKGVIRSRLRLIYEDVAAIIEDDDKAMKERYQSWLPHCEALHSLARKLIRLRERRGAIEFDTQETMFQIGEDKKIKAIVPRSRNFAHRLIEECMILANVAAAKYLLKHHMPALFRNHEPPEYSRVTDLQSFLSLRGLKFKGKGEPHPKDYNKLLKEAKGRDDFYVIQTVMLRSLSQAVYSEQNQGHFGLALEAYAHFTSPIRRYPDLLVHRALSHLIAGGDAKSYAYEKKHLAQLGEHCSYCERRADEATRDAIAWLKCEFMSNHVGQAFHGMISGVTGFGLFVQLEEFFVDGLVHISALENDYFVFNEKQMKLIGRRSGRSYSLGDKCRVKLVRVDLDSRQIDFELITGTGAKSGARAGAKRKLTSKKAKAKIKKGRTKAKRPKK